MVRYKEEGGVGWGGVGWDVAQGRGEEEKGWYKILRGRYVYD